MAGIFFWKQHGGFSEIKRVKIDCTSKLRPHVFSDLFFIMLHIQDIQYFDLTSAAKFWNVSGQWARRPSQAPYGKREDDSDEDTDKLGNFILLDPKCDTDC